MRRFSLILATSCFVLGGAACEHLWTTQNNAESCAQLPPLTSLNDTAFELIAHRGFASCFPENTLGAIERAIEIGVASVEIDVALTKDSVFVLMHDSAVDRTTDGTGSLSQLTFNETRELDACSWFGPDWEPCPVPSLVEALEQALGRGRLLVDVKPVLSRDGVERLLQVVRGAHMESQVEVVSFHRSNLRLIRELDSTIVIGYLRMDTVGVREAAALGATTVLYWIDSLARDTGLVTFAAGLGMRVGTWTITTPEHVVWAREHGVRRFLADMPLAAAP